MHARVNSRMIATLNTPPWDRPDGRGIDMKKYTLATLLIGSMLMGACERHGDQLCVSDEEQTYAHSYACREFGTDETCVVPFVQLDAGTYHNCALRDDNSIECWGRNDYDQASAPNGYHYTQVAAGLYHSCALTQSGAIECWGRNRYGQTTVPEGNDFQAVSAGFFHPCALKNTGSIVCWGHDQFGQSQPPEL